MDYQTNEVKKKFTGMTYISIGLAILCVILPFMSWLKVPVAAGLYSLFGMSDKPTKFSLFGYILSGSNYQDDTVFFATMIIALIALLGIILNIVYVVKTLKKKEKMYKYGTIGAIIMLIVSILFIAIVGLTSAILKVVELTWMPYITFIVSVVHIVIIKKLKKQN